MEAGISGEVSLAKLVGLVDSRTHVLEVVERTAFVIFRGAVNAPGSGIIASPGACSSYSVGEKSRAPVTFELLIKGRLWAKCDIRAHSPIPKSKQHSCSATQVPLIEL